MVDDSDKLDIIDEILGSCEKWVNCDSGYQRCSDCISYYQAGHAPEETKDFFISDK